MIILIFQLKNKEQTIYTTNAEYELIGSQIIPNNLGKAQLPWSMMPVEADPIRQNSQYQQEMIKELAKRGLDYQQKLEQDPNLAATAETLKVIDPINVKIEAANQKLPNQKKVARLEIAGAQFLEVKFSR